MNLTLHCYIDEHNVNMSMALIHAGRIMTEW